MKKWWLIVLSSLLFLSKSEAKTGSDSLENIPRNRSLLWKITGNGMKSSSYIFGTMHLICKDDYVWTPAMKKSFNAVKEVCFEMDMDDPKLLMEIANGMIDLSGKQLKDYFSDEDYKLVSNYFADSMGIDFSMMSQLKPTALISLLATTSINCSQQESYEKNILEEAQKIKLDITGLELPAEQFAVLDNIPADTFINEILRMVKGQTQSDSDYYQLAKAYRTQDIAKLYTLISESDANKYSLSSFLDERNIKWIERMEERMDQQPVFFAVGAGHLWGKNGVLQLLRDKGYKVEPVK